MIRATYDHNAADLYIDVISSKQHGTGLGSELFRRAVDAAESRGNQVLSVSGNFSLKSTNLQLLESTGLESTPGFKMRIRNGYSSPVIEPNKLNKFMLKMELPR